MCGWICGGKTKPCEGGDSWCGREAFEEERRRSQEEDCAASHLARGVNSVLLYKFLSLATGCLFQKEWDRVAGGRPSFLPQLSSCMLRVV